MKNCLLSLFLLGIFFSCKNQKNESQMKMPPAIDLANLDTIVKPQEDFFRFVNGKWLDSNKIPSDRARWGSFDELRKRNDSVTLKVLEDAISKGLNEGSDQKKAADLFTSILDTIGRNENGMKPIKPIIAQIDSLQSFKDVEHLNAVWAPYGGAIFGISVFADLKNSNTNTAYFGGPQLGLGRDYYQKNDDESKEKLTKYQEHIARMLTLTKDVNGIMETDIPVVAQNIVDFEKRLGKSLLTNVERRDARNRYNKYAVTDLNQLLPDYDFNNYFNTIGAKIDTIIVQETNYFKEIAKIASEGNIETIKNYLKWSIIDYSANKLTTELDEANFDFYGKTLRGTEEMRPLKERALGTVNNVIGEAVGQLYVDEVFPPAAKDSAKLMVDYLLKAFKKHINALEWMSDSTKIKALDKLSKFTVKIGYPDKWEDYSKMEIKSKEEGGTYFDNLAAAAVWSFNDNLKDYGQPVDKTKWGMSPQTVNAYYSPVFNEIVFPAAILQPPFFNFEADAAVNYGGIGAVIGHEISHGFDDSGARFDGNGNLKNWWTEEDAEKFAAVGKALAEQYSAYEPVEGNFVNGEFTLGENIGDLGGANTALTALKMYLSDNGDPGEIDSFSPIQRFFISWGTIWRTKYKDEAIKNQIKTDPHSPGMYRATGPIINIDAFHEAFETKEGDAMYKPKEERIKIW